MLPKFICAVALSLAFVSVSPVVAGEDCLGVSIGPGCIGIEGGRDVHYRRVPTRPPHARVYVAPKGGHYYYDPDDLTYYYEEDKED
jgi:hypothetical protein